MKGKRLFSLLLALTLCVGVLPVTASAASAHSHSCCGTTCNHSTKHRNVTYSLAWSGGYFSGSYVYLKDDVTISTNYYFSGTVFLCLNGHTLTLDKNLIVNSGATLLICDCGGTGKVVSESYCIWNDGSLRIFGGNYQCYIVNDGNMYVHGGRFADQVDNNKNAYVYDGVFNDRLNNCGDMTIYDATIEEGCIYNDDDAILQIEDCDITSEYSTLLNSGTATINGGTFHTTNFWSDEAIYNSETLTVNDAEITSDYGNGISSSGTLTISGGTVTGGAESFSIYNSGSLEISKAPSIESIKLYYPNELTFNYSGKSPLDLEVEFDEKYFSAGDTVWTGNTDKISLVNLLNEGYILKADGDQVKIVVDEWGGKCGDNLNWRVYEIEDDTVDGTAYKLVISGTGDMYDFGFSSHQPWYKFNNHFYSAIVNRYITQVVIEEGATSIGTAAFAYFDMLDRITIPEGVTSIGNYAFQGDYDLEMYLPVSLKKIGMNVIVENNTKPEAPKAAYYAGCIHQWNLIDIQYTYTNSKITWANVLQCKPNTNQDDGDCLTPLYCSVCGGIDRNGHSFTNYKSNNDATCTADGTKTAKCDNCDETDTVADTGTAKGHDFTGNAEYCKNSCGTKNPDYNPCASGHSFTDYKSNNDATCTADGTKTAKCDNCDETDTVADECSKKDHDFSDNAEYCRNGCNTKNPDYDPCASGHSFTNYKSNNDATCTADGTKTAKCDNCDETDTVADEGSKKEHDFSDNAEYCRNSCNTKNPNYDPCASGHSFTNYKSNNDATCTADGTKTAKCDHCDETDTIDDVGSKKDHDFSDNAEYCKLGCNTKNPDYTTPVTPPYKPVRPTSPSKPASTPAPGKPEQAESPFNDVSKDDYFFDAVIWAAENGITSGTSAMTFDPHKVCTRAEMVTFLWRAAGKPEPDSRNNPFTDVTEADYFYKAVLWAVENGITKGTGATTFNPNDTCTRAQAATFLHRYAGSPRAGMANPFADAQEADYFFDAVIWAAEEAITKGSSATTFSPADFCTRAQIVTFLYRYQQD